MCTELVELERTIFTRTKTPDTKSFLEGINMHQQVPMPPAAPTFFATQHLLEGRVLSALTNQEVYSAIKRKEEKIATLRAVKNKPARLKAQIKGEQAELRAFILFLNEQDAA